MVLKRIKIYNTRIYEKKDIYLNIMNERNNDAVSITFPSTCWMKTKRGSYDFAFNLQEIITENHIILTGMLLSESNDRKTIKYVLNNIYETIKYLLKCKKNWGNEETIMKYKEEFANTFYRRFRLFLNRKSLPSFYQ